MKAYAIRMSPGLAALAFAATHLQAAPSLSVQKPPVTAAALTGPMSDPASTNGQWFLANDGTEEYRTHEFYDNVAGFGGGNMGAAAIQGSVVPGSIIYVAGPGSPIVGFKIDARIANDTGTETGTESSTSNSHGETRQAGTERYAGTLVDTKMTAEFAIADTNLLPVVFNPPYFDFQPYIVADNEDQTAWYCWNPQQSADNPGNYYVPVWDFGDIPIGQSTNRILSFSTVPWIDPADPRYNVIVDSELQGTDILANRTSSLKISTWIDILGIDSGFPYPEEPLRGSDVSVFHNEEPPYDPPHKMHWPQLPDPNGWDVRACFGADGLQKVLADDFRCTSNGPITKITFWGSFQYDEYNYEAPFHGITNIHLSIHNDIPAGEIAEWSMPEIPALWETDIDPYMPPTGWEVSVTPEVPSMQGWYDPNHELVQTNNHMNYFRYEVTIPPEKAFVQTSNTIYWLDISVLTEGFNWGWKTSVSPHFNDDGVWADLPVTNLMQWKELRDPLEPQISLDLAFVIDGEPPEEEAYDFGDLPDAYNTTLLNNGAQHMIVQGINLGANIDPEPDGQPDPAAMGDDQNMLYPGIPFPPGDEDGIQFTTPFIPGQMVSFIATATVGGQLDVYMDADNSGNWSAGDLMFTGGIAAGPNPLSFLVPASTLPGPNVIRARFNSTPGLVLPPTGPAADGEVEDYMINVEETDWGDAPDPTYPTLNASTGPFHILPGGAANALLYCLERQRKV